VICREVSNNFDAHATGSTGNHGNFFIGWYIRSALFSHAFYPSGALVQRVECLLEMAKRSSTSSMPIEMRTRSAGGTSSEPSADTCVIFSGCSIKDSTPPSDSAKHTRRVFRHA